MELIQICKNAKTAERAFAKVKTAVKNEVLEKTAERLQAQADFILGENEKDLANAREKQMPDALVDRLKLTKERIDQMAQGLKQIVGLDDPIGEVLGMKQRPNGLLIGRKRVPLGVVGIIYESRPNVTADAFGRCFKTSKVMILKGGSDAIHSNLAIVSCIQDVLKEEGLDPNMIQVISDTDRNTT